MAQRLPVCDEPRPKRNSTSYSAIPDLVNFGRCNGCNQVRENRGGDMVISGRENSPREGEVKVGGALREAIPQSPDGVHLPHY